MCSAGSAIKIKKDQEVSQVRSSRVAVSQTRAELLAQLPNVLSSNFRERLVLTDDCTKVRLWSAIYGADFTSKMDLKNGPCLAGDAGNYQCSEFTIYADKKQAWTQKHPRAYLDGATLVLEDLFFRSTVIVDEITLDASGIRAFSYERSTMEFFDYRR